MRLGPLLALDAEAFAEGASQVLFDVSECSAEVGFWIHPAHRGTGIAVAALKLAARFARANSLRELTARTLPENPASQHTLEDSGFTFEEGRIDTTPSGQRVELLHYSRPIHEDTPT